MSKNGKIRFYYFDKLLGKFDCPEFNDEKDRRKIAKDNGIMNWTHFILGENRVMGVKLVETKDNTADYLPLPSGDYLVWITPECRSSTIKLTL